MIATLIGADNPPAMHLIFLNIQSLYTKVKYANYFPIHNAQIGYLHLNFAFSSSAPSSSFNSSQFFDTSILF